MRKDCQGSALFPEKWVSIRRPNYTFLGLRAILDHFEDLL